MNFFNDKVKFKSFLGTLKKSVGAAAISCLNIRNFNDPPRPMSDWNYYQQSMPQYLHDTLEYRHNPLNFCPWGKSIIMVAVPFAELPPPEKQLPRGTEKHITGYIPGYAARTDYHIYGYKLMLSILEALKDETKTDFQSAICVDSAPLAERFMAQTSGLGSIGLNCCVHIPGYGSNVFLASIVTDLELINVSGQTENKTGCDKCGRCLRACPNAALGQSPDEFKLNRCISYLSIEKRGLLAPEEESRLGDSIFGCGICSSACANGSGLDDYPVDLKWLLLAGSGEVRRAIKPTPLEYAGVTLLRRNALAVLANHANEQSLNLIREFAATTQSQQLRQAAANIIVRYM